MRTQPFEPSRRQALALALSALAMPAAHAQAWPAKPIRMVVPYPPGGPTDVLARLVAQELSTRLGQQVVIDNKAGASGTIGAQMVAKAPPDGYTLLANASIHVITPALVAKMPYDAMADFAAVSQIADVPLVAVVSPQLGVKTMRELVDLAKARAAAGTPLLFASSGNAAAPHLAGEAFKISTGVPMTHVPYKGSAPALTDVMGGHVQVMFDSMPSSMPFIKGGKLRALAVTSARRATPLPQVPTMAEAGISGMDLGSWYGVWAPAGTPRAIVDRLGREIGAIARDPAMHQRLLDLGAEGVGSTPEQFEAFNRSELAKWGQVVRQSGAKAD